MSIHDDYRDAARHLLSEIPGTSVDPLGHVKLMPDGAFVECQVWVPTMQTPELGEE